MGEKQMSLSELFKTKEFKKLLESKCKQLKSHRGVVTKEGRTFRKHIEDVYKATGYTPRNMLNAYIDIIQKESPLSLKSREYIKVNLMECIGKAIKKLGLDEKPSR